jgi:hypothetical protein
MPQKKIVATGVLVFDFEFFVGVRHGLRIGYEGTILHPLHYCYVTTSMRDLANMKGLTAEFAGQCSKNLLCLDRFGNIETVNLEEHVESMVNGKARPTFAKCP